MGALARKLLFCKLKHRLVCRGLQMCSFVGRLFIISFFFFCLFAANFLLTHCLSTLVHNVWRYGQQALAGFCSLSLHCGCCGVVSYRLPLHPLVDYTVCWALAFIILGLVLSPIHQIHNQIRILNRTSALSNQ